MFASARASFFFPFRSSRRLIESIFYLQQQQQHVEKNDKPVPRVRAMQAAVFPNELFRNGINNGMLYQSAKTCTHDQVLPFFDAIFDNVLSYFSFSDL